MVRILSVCLWKYFWTHKCTYPRSMVITTMASLISVYSTSITQSPMAQLRMQDLPSVKVIGASYTVQYTRIQIIAWTLTCKFATIFTVVLVLARIRLCLQSCNPSRRVPAFCLETSFCDAIKIRPVTASWCTRPVCNRNYHRLLCETSLQRVTSSPLI